jgi:CRP-like cAMP-binding protein
MFKEFRAYVSRHVVLTEGEFELLESFARPKKLRKRQYLLQEGDVCRYNCFITSGLMRMYSVDEKGDEHIIRFAAENWWISDRESLLTRTASKFNIDAIEDTDVLLFEKSSMDLIMNKVPKFGKMVNDMLDKSFITFQNRLNEVISNTAETKYSNFVQRYPDFSLRVPQAMIASYLGIKPETLSRLRNKR